MHIDDAKLTHENASYYRVTNSVRSNIRHNWWRTFPVAVIGSFVIVLWGIAAVAWPLHAAMNLNYFDLSVDAQKVTLEWSTASENEVLGFEIDYKEEEASNSKYHLIGSRLAQGNKDHGATYRLDVNEGLKPNTIYCFRLREITLNNEQGEIIDRCGYGLNLTPTPATTPIVTVELTSTVISSVTPTITVAFTPAVGMTDTSLQPVVVTVTPTVIPLDGQSIPDQTIPTETLVMPTETPTPFSESPLAPPITTTVTSTIISQTSAGNLEDRTSNSDNAPNAMTANVLIDPVMTAIVVANPPYIILTVTPTEAALAVAPTFTSFPAAMMDTEPNLIAATLPNTQNLMILLLCGVFSGASGLGILGLVTTLLYMRSRTTEQQTIRKR